MKPFYSLWIWYSPWRNISFKYSLIFFVVVFFWSLFSFSNYICYFLEESSRFETFWLLDGYLCISCTSTCNERVIIHNKVRELKNRTEFRVHWETNRFAEENLLIKYWKHFCSLRFKYGCLAIFNVILFSLILIRFFVFHFE